MVGKLDRRITIESLTESRDDFGGVVETWATLATRWAGVETAGGARGSGDEGYDAGQKLDYNSIFFTLRRDNTTKLINAKSYRIVYDGDTYDIRNVNEQYDQYRRMYVVIEAKYKGL
jgi:head-tail adaptor